jgi:class 3 adenylate cyclase/predicted ATPase
MSEIRKWLESIGLGRYVDAFDANDIDMDLLNQVDDQMLKDIGVASAGHRLRIRNAIAKLPSPPGREVNSRTTTATDGTTAASAERRQLTVMFSDLVGSTALSARLDPEDLRGIIGAYHHCCTELIERNGGFIAQYMGDGVLVYFGYPRALEDDAERAVRAGLDLVEAVPKLATHAGSALQVRVGIATGLVVVGDLIGAGVAQEQAVVGETPNLASRLQALAEPGAVVIEANTRQLTGGLFEYRDLGTVALKGFTENVPAWQVLGAGSAESRFEALRVTTTTLVGRDEEIELLLRRWEQAKRGDGAVVLISGEPGIGKSRIAQDTVARLSSEPHTRLRYFCSPHHQDSALYPGISQLERAAGFGREDTDEQRLAKLEAVLAKGTDDLRQVVPLMAELLSIATGDRYPPLDLPPQKRKEKTLHAQVAQVEGLAARQPVLIVVEDIQWADPTTRESLDLLIERVPVLRVLMIITFRPDFKPMWVGRPEVTLLTLRRLPPRQREEMIASLTGGKALPSEIADQIIDRTDGVPLFIEELTKTVIESGVLADVGDHYEMTGPMSPLAIPMTLHASLLARLDRLSPTREVAQVGAALGRQFSYQLMSAVAGMPAYQVDDALVQLVRAELIFQRGTPPDAQYTFKHALVQDAAYGTLLRSRRRQLHARIAATLEDRFPEMVMGQPALLAHHCAEAGLAENAVVYRFKAGQQAMARSAMVEAVAQLQKGLGALASLPASAWRQQKELDLQMALGPALIATKGFAAPQVGETVARARELAEQINRPEYLVPLLYGQWAFHLIRAEHKLALSLAEQLEKLGEDRNDVAAQLQGRRAGAWTRCYLGQFLAARALLERCHDLSDPTRRGAGGSIDDPYVMMLAQLAVTLAYLGYIDQAWSRVNEALSEARRIRHVHTLVEALQFATLIQIITRSPEPRRYVEELQALSTEHGFPLFLAAAKVFRGWSLIMTGAASEGLALVTESMVVIGATGTVANTPLVFILLAEGHAILERPAEGLNCLSAATQMMEATGERVNEAELHRLRGDLLKALGDQVAAEQSYHRAIAVAGQQSAKIWELRAANSLARLWQNLGKRAEARDLLAPIYGWFTEGFDTPVLQDAKALLEELGRI